MGKAAETEDIKLRATWFNNVSVGLLITGFLVPYLALIQDAHFIQDLIAALRTGPYYQYLLLQFSRTFGIALALAGALVFRRLAIKEIAKLKD
jgi:hypothetical protein